MRINNIKNILKKDAVLSISWILAIASSFFVVPDRKYIEYIDINTLAILFSLMAVMAGLKSLGVFSFLGQKLISCVCRSGSVSLILVLLCFFSSMVITNDVALITFVPFAVETLRMARLDEKIVHVVVLQTIAANLGSMVTPIGNPQNIYLYFKSGLSALEFFHLTAPYAVLSLILLTALCFTGKNIEIAVTPDCRKSKFSKDNKILVYIAEFAICLAVIGKYLPAVPVAVVCATITFFTDRKVLAGIDYGLLLTFVGFFVFVGNMGRIDFLVDIIRSAVSGNEMAVTIGLSQIISNVPAVLLLAGFTADYPLLIIASNMGGLGTLIASMANLISYKHINKECAHLRHAYLRWFTILCAAFLAALVILYFCIENV